MLTIEDRSKASVVVAPIAESERVDLAAVPNEIDSPQPLGTAATRPANTPWRLADVVLVLAIWLFGSFVLGLAAALVCLRMGIKPSGKVSTR